MIKLSIIIPYYNAKGYTDELLDVLNPQVKDRDDVEVILVDDGSPVAYKTKYEWCQVYRKVNGGCATARNRGLEKSQGIYIAFIDADDLVPEYYVDKLIKKFEKSKADVIDFSWKSLNTSGTQHNYKLKSDKDRLTNPSVCTRAFSREFIGDNSFNELKDSTEDEDFSRKLGYLDPDNKYRHVSITDYMYFYRTAVIDSKVKRFKKGLMNTKRVVYYYNHVTSDMTDLFEEIKAEDKRNEVWLLTNKCDIPELKRYCHISQPINIWGHFLRGEPYKNCTLIKPPIETQVVIYCEFVNKVGGISTFIYNFCAHMKEYYDIVVVYDRFDLMQLRRLSRIVRCEKNDPHKTIICDSLILNRLTDQPPSNITYKQLFQMCHACRQQKYRIPQNGQLINVSDASQESWGAEASHGIVIHNLAYFDKKQVLFLVSATRIGATDKGENEKRMRILANKLNEKHIPYIWLNFSDNKLNNMPENFINMPPMIDLQDIIRRADYLVQLSDQEAYSMAILEALTNNTAVICTPFDSASEQGVVDCETGYIVPYDMDFDVTELLNVPQFDFKYDNETIIKQWRKLLGNTTPLHNYTYDGNDFVEIKIIQDYYDMQLQANIKSGTVLSVTVDRAYMIANAGYGTILGD